MMGDRYGDVIKIVKHKERYVGVPSSRTKSDTYEVAHIKLDKSGKTMKFILADCEVL